jgi:hypothetical protein
MPELLSTDAIAAGLKSYLIEKNQKDSNSKFKNKDLKQNNKVKEDLTRFNDQQILIQLRKHVLQQNIQRHQNQLYQQDIFQTISHYLIENPRLNYERFIVLKQISPENIKKYFSSQNFLYLTSPSDPTTINSSDFIK